MTDRKIGNNKESCKLYRAADRLTRNKKRAVAKAKRASAKKASKLVKRFIAGKPVRSSLKAKVSGTSRGNMPNGEHRAVLKPTKPAQVLNFLTGEWQAARV
jgi:hypothetical protein